MFEYSVAPDQYELGKAALRASIIEDGGLLGLFDQLRSDRMRDVMDKYGNLLELATSPSDREDRKRRAAESSESWGDSFDRNFMELAATQPDVRPEDIPALMIAIQVCGTAFPGIPLEEIPKE